MHVACACCAACCVLRMPVACVCLLRVACCMLHAACCGWAELQIALHWATCYALRACMRRKIAYACYICVLRVLPNITSAKLLISISSRACFVIYYIYIFQLRCDSVFMCVVLGVHIHGEVMIFMRLMMLQVLWSGMRMRVMMREVFWDHIRKQGITQVGHRGQVMVDGLQVCWLRGSGRFHVIPSVYHIWNLVGTFARDERKWRKNYQICSLHNLHEISDIFNLLFDVPRSHLQDRFSRTKSINTIKTRVRNILCVCPKRKRKT